MARPNSLGMAWFACNLRHKKAHEHWAHGLLFHILLGGAGGSWAPHPKRWIGNAYGASGQMTHAETHVEKSRSAPQGVAKVYPPCPISPRTLPWSVRAVSQVGGTTAGGLQSEEKLQQKMSLSCEALSTPPQLLFKPVSASRTTLRRKRRAMTEELPPGSFRQCTQEPQPNGLGKKPAPFCSPLPPSAS